MLQIPNLQARRFLMDAMIRLEGFAGLHDATGGRKPWPVRIMIRTLNVQREEGYPASLRVRLIWVGVRRGGRLGESERLSMAGGPAAG